MDIKHIKAVHYVHANDPVGRMLIQAAGDMWSGTGELPPWYENEYLRGQVETICRSVYLLTEHEQKLDEEEDKDRAAMLIEAASLDTLDVALLTLYSPNHDYCYECGRVTEWINEQCTGCGRTGGMEA